MVFVTGELSRIEKVGLLQNRFDNVTVPQSAIIMVFGNKFVPDGKALVSRVGVSMHPAERNPEAARLRKLVDNDENSR